MTIADDLERLSQLHRDGTLNDTEFAQAKSRLLNESADAPASGRSLGEAANRYVTFQMVMGVVGVIIMLIFFFKLMLPAMQGDGFPGSGMGGPKFKIEGLR